jgi:hypothetical protein
VYLQTRLVDLHYFHALAFARSRYEFNLGLVCDRWCVGVITATFGDSLMIETAFTG